MALNEGVFEALFPLPSGVLALYQNNDLEALLIQQETKLVVLPFLFKSAVQIRRHATPRAR